MESPCRFSCSLRREVMRLKGLPLDSEDGATLSKVGDAYQGQRLAVSLMSKNFYGIGFNFKDVHKFLTPLLLQFKSLHIHAGLYKFEGELKYSADISMMVHPDYCDAALEVATWLRQCSIYDYSGPEKMDKWLS